MLLFAILSALVTIASSQCSSTDYSWNNIQVWGLKQVQNAKSALDCANACCADSSCQIWQYCGLSNGCGGVDNVGCWVGVIGTQHAGIQGWISNSSVPPPSPYVVKIDRAPPNPSTIPNIPPVTDPHGNVLSLDTISLSYNGKRVIQIAGEMHYSRVPRDSWAADLAKMKAGGLDAVSAYLFWIHHEEIQDKFTWDGNRDLRSWILTAQAAGLKVELRIGPWAHGECRNGGFPDWVVKSGVPLRTNNPNWISLVKPYFSQVAQQIKGLSFQEGGPVISIQLENETPDTDYLLALRALSVDLGMSPGLFWQITGWPSPDKVSPMGLLVPFFGGYTDSFWDRTIGPVISSNFLFGKPGSGGYPYLTIETGGGMASAYHRRIHIVPADVGASSQIFIANGAKQVGHYMYHGGTDPTGVLSTMQESQISGYPNDLPIKTYDFHAPLGECGQPRPHYNYIKRMGMMTRDWSSWLATMQTFLPNLLPSGESDTKTLRWAVLSDGKSGLIHVSNRQTFANMIDHSDIHLTLSLLDGNTLLVPSISSPGVDVPSGSWAAWPFNMPLPGGVVLSYATAQPLCVLNNVVVFFSADKVASEFALSAVALDGSSLGITSCNGKCTLQNNIIYARSLQTGTSAALSLHYVKNSSNALTLVLFDNSTSARVWKAPLAGIDRLFITDENSYYLLQNPNRDNSQINLVTELRTSTANIDILPAPSSLSYQGKVLKGVVNGLFTRYTLPLPLPQANLSLTQVQPAGPPRIVPKGPAQVAQAPNADGTLGEFKNAAVWEIQLNTPGQPLQNYEVRLRVNYSGDVARVYVGSGTDPLNILADHFWNGHDMDVPISRAGLSFNSTLSLRVLPLGPTGSGAPIYFEIPPAYNSNGVAIGLNSVELVHVFTAVLSAF